MNQAKSDEPNSYESNQILRSKTLCNRLEPNGKALNTFLNYVTPKQDTLGNTLL